MKTVLTFTLKVNEKGEIFAHSDYKLTPKQERVAIKECNRLLQELLTIDEDEAVDI